MNPKPTHEQIARRAQQIWLDRGSPWGRDDEIWLEAERQLADGDKGNPVSAERIEAETAAESMAEYHITPPVPPAQAVKAAIPGANPGFPVS
ncbi:MAG TPA: DUF2934 domain-containing protein [Opitutaceae bacterium]|nr:DUF2934 domain-containing protein [Opitutaceae bacterium]